MMNFAQIPMLYRTKNGFYESILSAATTLGYTLPNDNIQVAQMSLIDKLQQIGVWYVLDVLYIFKTGDSGLSDFATLNWILPASYQITLVNSPSFDGDGFTGNSTSSYLSTNYNPSTNGIYYVRTSASRFSYITTAGSPQDTTNPLDGVSGGAQNLSFGASTTAQRINQSTTNLPSAGDLTGTGYKAINRPDASTVELYSETTKTTFSRTDDVVFNSTQYITRANAQYGNMEFSMYGMGGSMTETQHNNLRLAFLDYIADL